MLEIKDLRTRVGGREVLGGLNLTVNKGEVHAIMGPNGSGKSTLAYTLAGRPGYDVTGGSVTYRGNDLLALAPEERAQEGVFLGFQYPVEIPGVNNVYLLKAALNAARKHRGLPEVDAFEFLTLVREKMKVMQMDEAFLSRGVNEGFSGGEKKRNEILQMLVLEPSLALLDETDSGLDIDALKVVSDGVNLLRDPSRAVIVITHYQRLLEYIVPDYVHVLANGRISIRVRPEVSQLTSAGSVVINGFQVPALATRRVETTVELGSGQSFMIGGLMQNTQNNSIDRAPGLGNLPVLGTLFRSNGFRKNETELVIVVTPYLVKPVSAGEIKLPTDGYRTPSDFDRIIMGQTFTGKTGEQAKKPTMGDPVTVPATPSVGGMLPAPAQKTSGSKASRKSAAANTPAPGFGN